MLRDAILTNHVGFLPESAKCFVVANPPATDFTVTRGIVDGNSQWRKEMEVVCRGALRHAGSELNDAWVGDFSGVREPGVYLIHCGSLVSRPVLIHKEVYDQALRTLYNYFPTQRCGDSRSGWNAPCHLDDAVNAVTGEPLDLTGGWHQSCDLRKWMFGTPYGLIGLAQLGLRRDPRWDEGRIADELRWGNLYFHKMIRQDGGLMDHVVYPVGWSGRRVYPNDPPPHAACMAIAGQAMAARYLAERDPGHSRLCLEAARRLWTYQRSSAAPRRYAPRVLPPHHDWLVGIFDVFCAPVCGEELYAALRLYEATDEIAYLDAACALAGEMTALQVGGDPDQDPAAACFFVDAERKALAANPVFGHIALAEMALLRPDHPDAPRWRRAVELMMEQKCRMAERNPWGLIPSYWRLNAPGADRPAGSGSYRYFMRHRAPNGGELRVGANGDLCAAALFLLRAHRLTGDARCRTVAQRQIDWIMGCNPFDASTIEGVGLNQPLRFINDGEFFPPTPQIPGAVMTGIMGDADDNLESFSNNCSTEYDMPVGASLMWLLSELTGGGAVKENP